MVDQQDREREGTEVAGSEPVTSPDQHHPTNRKAWRIAGVLTALALVSMMFCNNDISGLEKIWLIGIAAGLLAIIVGDAVLRRMGLRQ
ncbi:MAG TPA: DUF2631 domain-containing protein [Micromonosporaceae bacterium]|nr:DUF2631 domain-containing protein [Micromonosporaceae bacterium]